MKKTKDRRYDKISQNSALTPKTYPGESTMNGFECTAIVCGNVVTFKVRGRTSIKLGTSSNYAHCAQFSELSPLIASKSDRIKRVIINNKYFGQLRFDISTCNLRIGYTFNNSGNAVDIPQDTDFYIEETFAL